jgi:transposase
MTIKYVLQFFFFLIDRQRRRKFFVARRLGVSQSVVSRSRRRDRETGIYHRRQGQGRKRKTTYAEDRLLRTSAKSAIILSFY